MKITFDNVEYEINMPVAIKSGAAVRIPTPIHFNDLTNGDLFFFDDTIDKGLFIKSGENSANRIAGNGSFLTRIGSVDRGCIFQTNPKVSIFKNGNWVDKV